MWIGSSTVLKPPQTKLWREAWALTEAGIVQMAAEVAAAGSRFLLMLIPHPPQVHAPPEAGPAAYPQRRLRALAEQNGFDVLDLLPPFRAHYLRNKSYLYGFSEAQKGDGHWNQEGHRQAAAALSSRLCETLSR